MKPYLSITLLCAFMGMSTQAMAYDTQLAQSYQQQFSQAKGASAGKAIGLISAEAFVKQLQSNKAMLAVDIRTPQERQIFGLAMENKLNIGIDELFTPENLAQLPKDKPVVLVCKSGARAMAAGTALRHLGYDNVKILKGGYGKLTKYVGPNIAK
ncbi:rhodanese-like domain-containing protein [Shewanella canadensis]|uniref:Rhodanese-like domain-containing protein n=1 Tax=Shewanella canadensis TaxID=271096 RepID=A0A3S0IMP0_9GAMM|nr:rhodanese-like domain-containing protein [Shewanella canadensis]RTR37767.1 rhodanese-like domain-containing protein [Shewanella canadensis]